MGTLETGKAFRSSLLKKTVFFRRLGPVFPPFFGLNFCPKEPTIEPPCGPLFSRPLYGPFVPLGSLTFSVGAFFFRFFLPFLPKWRSFFWAFSEPPSQNPFLGFLGRSLMGFPWELPPREKFSVKPPSLHLFPFFVRPGVLALIRDFCAFFAFDFFLFPLAGSPSQKHFAFLILCLV